jgi:hypothetical protein
MTPLDYMRKHIKYESLRAIGQCVIIADDAGFHLEAERAADQFIKMSHGMDALQIEIRELKERLRDG